MVVKVIPFPFINSQEIGGGAFGTIAEEID
jgi:hypothetical protein